MKIYKMVEMARNNDPDAKIWLEEHYEPIVRENVQKKYGNAASEKMVELLPSLIDYYFENNIKGPLSHFLNWKPEEIINKEIRQKEMIGSCFPVEPERLEIAINHYANNFYEKIKDFNNYLSDDELKKYSYVITKSICFKHKESKNDFRSIVWNNLVREAKYYKENEELLLQKYVIYIELTDKIFEYFSNKYQYIVNSHKRMGQNVFAKQNYSAIIKNALMNLKVPMKNLDEIILSQMNILYQKDMTSAQNATIAYKKGEECDTSCIYENYAYIKEFIFNKFSGKVIFDDEYLKKQIEIKYNDYITAYLNGTTKGYVSRYLNTRLTTYFNRYLANNNVISEEQSNNAKISFEQYKYYIDKYLKKIRDVNSLEESKEKLTKAYEDLFIYYCKKRRKTPIDVLIRKALKDEVDNINNSYVDSDEMNLSYKTKEVKSISKGGINNGAN